MRARIANASWLTRTRARTANCPTARTLSSVAPSFNGLKAAGISYGFGDEWIRVGGVKFAADGSASERTMRMSTPYVGTNDYGILTMTQEEIYEAVEDAHRHGFRSASMPTAT